MKILHLDFGLCVALILKISAPPFQDPSGSILTLKKLAKSDCNLKCDDKCDSTQFEYLAKCKFNCLSLTLVAKIGQKQQSEHCSGW